MTVYRPVLDEARVPANRDFYAPGFEVRIEGENLPQNVLRDVREVKYIDGLTEIDRFELVVNNWDPAENRFKFIGSETAANADQGLHRLFQPCEKVVELRMGYAGNLITMMQGNFTMMEPHFQANAAPTLTVTGLNVLHQLRRKRHSGSWRSERPSAIAENLASLRDDGQPRLPLPLVVGPVDANAEPVLDYTAQTNQYDIDFLLNLARRHGYELVEQQPGQPSVQRRQLYFGPGSNARAPVNYALDWGRSMVEFMPTITSHNQVKSVTVRGWDRRAQRAIEEKIEFNDPELQRLNADLDEFVQCDPREEIVVDRPVFTREEARDYARAVLRDRAASVIEATGTTVGLPELRAGTRIRIGEIGSRLSGDYLVKKTEHIVNDSGYLTKFEARREQLPQVAS
ncbi:MAG: contractile injection system protein, VgrG/Pvc8 family [Pseudomonadota bacterium]